MGATFDYLEFFAGGGLARLGLGPRWRCVFANDICARKANAYRANFDGAPELCVGDVWNVTTDMLPGAPALSWASFPCQDLSLAGSGSGLAARRSGSYWGFWRLMTGLRLQRQKVPLIVLENVVGLLSSKGGADFVLLCQSIVEQGYRIGALVIDAALFVPQSRPRLFLVAYDVARPLGKTLCRTEPDSRWHPPKLVQARDLLPAHIRENWLWWRLPAPPARTADLGDLVLDNSPGIPWHSPEQTRRLLELMSPVHSEKLDAAHRAGGRAIGALYKRMRTEKGARVQRAEVRFDGLSGCLRTPAGGSSRQVVVVAESGEIRTRLLHPREAARLMGVADWYRLPENYNEAYHLMGDAVVVPAVRWLSDHLLTPLARALPAGARTGRKDAITGG